MRRGFTLVEMMIVIVLIILLATIVLAMTGFFMSGQAVRQGATIVTTTVARAKQLAASQKVVHFVVFGNNADGGWMEIHIDANGDGKYQGDADPASNDPDPTIEGDFIELPRFCDFEKKPDWIGFNPSGYIIFPAGFNEIQSGEFDANIGSSSPTPKGDLILKMRNENFRSCMDLDRGAGKIRRQEFLAE